MMILISDFWQSIINDEQIDNCPKWEVIDRAISRLDEKTYTLVVLDNEEGSNLLVGGGPSGNVVALSCSREHLLARRGNETKTISVVVGGQAGDYLQRNVISTEQAKDIAKAFFLGVNVQTLGHWDPEVRSEASRLEG
jgi:hypothetical protein